MSSEVAHLGTYSEPSPAKKQKLNGSTTNLKGILNGSIASSDMKTFNLSGISGSSDLANGSTSITNGDKRSTVDGEDTLKQRKEHLA